jgi:hypothetical protein
MFDSFDQELENEQTVGCVEEEEEDDEPLILNHSNRNLTHFNQLIDVSCLGLVS